MPSGLGDVDCFGGLWWELVWVADVKVGYGCVYWGHFGRDKSTSVINPLQKNTHCLS